MSVSECQGVLPIRSMRNNSGLRHIRVQVTHIERGKLGNCASARDPPEPATTHMAHGNRLRELP